MTIPVTELRAVRKTLNDTSSIFKGGEPNNKESLTTTLATSLEISKAKRK